MNMLPLPLPFHVIVSYVPLLEGVAGETLDPSPNMIGSLIRKIENSPGSADGVLWGMSPDGDPWPIFIIDQAQAIINHLVEWAEGSPTSWFDFRLFHRDDEYALALSPNLKKSVSRYRLAIELKTGNKVPENIDCKMLFKAISFCSSGNSETFKLVKSKLKSPVKIGFIDRSNFKDIHEIPEDFDPSNIYWIGPFEVQGDENNFLSSMLPKSRNKRKADRRKAQRK